MRLSVFLVYTTSVPFIIVVHIAGEVRYTGQKCQRCDEIIIPMLPGERMIHLESDKRRFSPAFPEGSFVGIITSEAGNHCGRVMMDRDADTKEPDEKKCNAVPHPWTATLQEKKDLSKCRESKQYLLMARSLSLLR